MILAACYQAEDLTRDRTCDDISADNNQPCEVQNIWFLHRSWKNKGWFLEDWCRNMSGQRSLLLNHTESEIPVLPRAVWEATDKLSQGDKENLRRQNGFNLLCLPHVNVSCTTISKAGDHQ